jgi:hypothetical protein
MSSKDKMTTKRTEYWLEIIYLDGARPMEFQLEATDLTSARVEALERGKHNVKINRDLLEAGTEYNLLEKVITIYPGESLK